VLFFHRLEIADESGTGFNHCRGRDSAATPGPHGCRSDLADDAHHPDYLRIDRTEQRVWHVALNRAGQNLPRLPVWEKPPEFGTVIFPNQLTPPGCEWQDNANQFVKAKANDNRWLIVGNVGATFIVAAKLTRRFGVCFVGQSFFDHLRDLPGRGFEMRIEQEIDLSGWIVSKLEPNIGQDRRILSEAC
jgi:hypothetical protein